MIQVKNSNVLIALACLWHSKLKALIKDVAEIAGIFITEGSRKKTWRGDLHGYLPLRAIDGRARIYTHPQRLAERINKRWIYDPKRPKMKCAVYHARCPKCGEGHYFEYQRYCRKCGADLDPPGVADYWHIHFQVHPKTEFVG